MESKIKASILVTSLLLIVVIFFRQDFGKVGLMSEFFIAKDEYQEILSTKNEITNPQQLNIKIDDYQLPYDSKTGDYLYNIETFDFDTIDIEVSANESLDYDVHLLEKEFDETTIQNNEPLQVILHTKEDYAVYEIYLTSLPIVEIDLDSPGPKNAPIGNPRQQGSLKLFTNDSTITPKERETNSDLYINLRGASSRAFPKNQYRINLREFTIGGDESNNHVSLLGLREDDDYILYAAYNDPEKVRNIFANNLWSESMGENNRFEINNGIEGKYVELFIEGRYWGLYGLTHPLDGKQVDLDKDKDPEKSELYYRTFSNESFNFEQFQASKGEELSLNRFELREVDEPYDDPDQWAPIYEYSEVLERGDAETVKNYLKEHTDLGNQVDYYLFSMFLQATDNNFKNHNYISKLDGDTRIMLESPWDLDLVLALRWDGKSELLSYINKDYPDWNFQPYKTMIHRARELGVEGVNQQIANRYQSLRNNQWSDEEMNNMLDSYEADIYGSGAIKRDKERWANTAYHEQFEGFRNYVMQRLDAMDQLILNERQVVE